MLVIGHRGTADKQLANTLEALYAGLQADVDMLAFDVHLTKDRIPVLVHGSYALHEHFSPTAIAQLTFSDLYKKTEERPVVPLSQVLDEFFGSILLNIELKGHGTGKIVAELIAEKYVKTVNDWDNVILSSFRGRELSAARNTSAEVNLALLHSQNPFSFIAYHRRLKLAAVGFHRLYLNTFALEIAKKTGLFTYVYTVNRPETAVKLAQKGVDGIVTDRPAVIIKEIGKKS
jgi:glycerophosphoryl diester phosphodiesterase